MAIGGELTPEQTVEAPIQGVSSRVKKKRQNLIDQKLTSFTGFVGQSVGFDVRVQRPFCSAKDTQQHLMLNALTT